MLKYFRNKKKLYQQGFNDGYECHKAMADRKIKNLKKKIHQQNKKIHDIENSLKIVSTIFNDARMFAEKLDKFTNIKLLEIAKEYQEDKNTANNIMQICRSYEKELPGITEKIERYKVN